jgi:hypothetical protein
MEKLPSETLYRTQHFVNSKTREARARTGKPLVCGLFAIEGWQASAV